MLRAAQSHALSDADSAAGLFTPSPQATSRVLLCGIMSYDMTRT